MPKPTIFFVVDVETTKKDGLVFDIGWNAIDRQNRIYSQGSYLAYDVLQRDMPFFLHKIGGYYKMVYAKKIRPLKYETIRRKLNAEMKKWSDRGYRVIFCAYNAAFDATRLGSTSRTLNNRPFLEQPYPLLCIWHYWCLHCPKTFQTVPSPSGKFWSTTAESVYAYEKRIENYEEPHIAFPDTLIESEILLNTLATKKKMPIVLKPDQLVTDPWRIANNRAINKPQPKVAA